MNEIQVRDLLFEIFPPESDSDWGDVLRRAKRPSPSLRRLTLLVAVVLFAVLAVGSALALSGRLGNLFHGTPVNDLTPRERFLMSEFDMNGKVELIARRKGLAFYVVRRKDGRLCYSIGDVRTHLTPAQREGRFRFGETDCPLGFPSRALPVLNHSYFTYRPGDREARMVGGRGFAAHAVARIGVIGRDNEIIFTLPVEGNVYSAGKRGFMGARGIVALDDKGKALWVQCTAIGRSPAPQCPSGGCGRFKNSPPPKVTPPKPARRPTTPSVPVVVQSGTADGVRFVIRGSRIEANFTGLTPAQRRLVVYQDGRVVLGCFKLVKVGGQANVQGTYFTKPFASVVRVNPWNPYAHPATEYAPFDGCTVSATYGHSWNDGHGTHDAVEVALTPRGRAYLAGRATARDIAWLARARVFHDIRYARRPLSSDEVARRLGSHVVSLRRPGASPPIGKLGIWLGEPRHIVLVERATTGRRLYLELRRGVQYRTNLLGLTLT